MLVDDRVGAVGGIDTALRILSAGFKGAGYNVEFFSFFKAPENPSFEIARKVPYIFREQVYNLQYSHKILWTSSAKLKKIVKKAWRLYADLRMLLYILPRRKGHIFVFTNFASAEAAVSSIKLIRRLGGDSLFIHQMHMAFDSEYIQSLLPSVEKRLLDVFDEILMLTRQDAESASKYFGQEIGFIENPILQSENVQSIVAEKRGATISCITRFTYQKRLELAISAFDAIAHDFPQWTLNIYGEGADRDKLATLIESSKNKHQILLNGPVDSKTAMQIWEKTDLNLMSSRFEGLPMTILEAASCATPTVATPCSPGLNQFVEGAGFLADNDTQVALEEALKQAMTSPELREAKARQGLSKIAENSVEKIVEKWEKIFHTISVERNR
ncbi:glycosyltransferase [Rothia sp. ZJ932]|uniref:glycosyltransferase n=1 Tax=Rothia sp. ZJ932 TaxID=2810516 RepID=UPI0019677FB5|nr:glycosyltransferase [Rothia sp. ZJ932]QRZ61181.1 glycosyltransferase [Rothia sp. ZJ932]